VKNVLKALIVWVLLLAVPLQAFASVTMLLCAPASVSVESKHDHVAVKAPHQHESPGSPTATSLATQVQDASSSQSHDKADTVHHQAGSKCGACASCGCGAGMVPSLPSTVAAVAPHFESVPFNLGHVPTVDLALPERPPRV